MANRKNVVVGKLEIIDWSGEYPCFSGETFGHKISLKPEINKDGQLVYIAYLIQPSWEPADLRESDSQVNSPTSLQDFNIEQDPKIPEVL